MTLAFFVFQTIFGWIGKSSEFYYGLTSTSLIGWYLIGGLIRKSTWKGFFLKPWQNMAVFLKEKRLLHSLLRLLLPVCWHTRGKVGKFIPE